MKTLVPAYYPSFSCLAGACRHSCCIGWDIEIDEETLALYRSFPDAGEILSHIEEGENGAYIRKKRDGRCPFLTRVGLCRLYSEHGAGCLSEICAKHPRYVSYLTSRVEMGLGLACEAAVPLILAGPYHPDTDVVFTDDGQEAQGSAKETGLLSERDGLLRALCDNTRTLDEILRASAWYDGYEPSVGKAMVLLAGEEALDPLWRKHLRAVAKRGKFDTPLPDSREARAILSYFVRRYIPQAIGEEDTDGAARVLLAFARLSVRILLALAENGRLTSAEAARMYSAEVEYDTEIVADLCDAIQMREL